MAPQHGPRRGSQATTVQGDGIGVDGCDGWFASIGWSAASVCCWWPEHLFDLAERAERTDALLAEAADLLIEPGDLEGELVALCVQADPQAVEHLALPAEGQPGGEAGRRKAGLRLVGCSIIEHDGFSVADVHGELGSEGPR